MTDPIACPFCGSRNVAHGLFGGDMIVKCIGCFSGGPPVDAPEFSDMVEKREEAVAAWNRRAEPSKPVAEAVKVKTLECQYAQEVGMPEYHCVGRCQYDTPHTIKPLEWKPAGGMKGLEATTICGTYWAYDNGSWSTERAHHSDSGTMETAKAAAQADYEQRIISALSIPPQHVEAQGAKGGDAFSQIVAARKAVIDAAAAYNARLAVARAERDRGNWSIKVDPEYHAMCDAQSAFHRTVQDLADAALSSAPEAKADEN